MKNAVIVDAVRTPMGKSKAGVFRNVRAEDLSALPTAGGKDCRDGENMFLLVSDANKVRHKIGIFGRKLNRSLRCSAQTSSAFSNHVGKDFNLFGDLIEQLMDGDEPGTANIPMRLFDLSM